jgi:enamine deaminase RidA (YjgF/YER057c/UK114 family)
MRRLRIAAALAAALVVTFAAGVVAHEAGLAPGWDFGGSGRPRAAAPPPDKDQVIHNVATDQANPFIAGGVSVGEEVALYFSSGTGPGGLNTAAPAGTPERFVDPAQFPGAVLTPGVTITEAQAMNAFARIADNLASVGLSPRDVITLRIYLDNAPGQPTMDFAGLNRAYRQFFANVDLLTGQTLPQPRGTGAPGPPIVVNPVRPSRTALEVAGLPSAGWLVEVEAVARFKDKQGRDGGGRDDHGD